MRVQALTKPLSKALPYLTLEVHNVTVDSRLILLSRSLAMGKTRILAEFWDFLRVRKKFWLAPIIIVLLLLSLLIVLTQGSALAPFIYALF